MTTDTTACLGLLMTQMRTSLSLSRKHTHISWEKNVHFYFIEQNTDIKSSNGTHETCGFPVRATWTCYGLSMALDGLVFTETHHYGW